MIELEINDDNLKKFLDDIRESDKKELVYYFKNDYKKQFIKMAKEAKNSYFVADNNKNPIAIGGFHLFKNKNTFQVWLLCTNKLKTNKKELFKYIKAKVETYKKNCFIMFNYIYKSNFKSLKFLENLGFEVKNLPNKDFKLFYYMKGCNFDLRYITN